VDIPARDARAEAQQVVGDAFEASVLEPSPPAVLDGPWFADDPFRPVAPWDDWLSGHPEHAEWAAARWLGGGDRRLGAEPPDLAETRRALHRLAVYVLSPARRRVKGKIGLRWTLGGFGTPFFGDDEQVRVQGTTIVRQQDDRAAAEPITTLEAAAAFVLDGPPDVAWVGSLDVPLPDDLAAALVVDPAAAAFLGDWYGFATSVLEAVRADPVSVEASRVQLWPEHFDLAFDCLQADRRGTFGASPGDAAVPQPYFYVLAPTADGSNLWNAGSFAGAILPFDELTNVADQRATVLQFLRARRDHLLAH
jgi:hypothetical protein